MNDRNRAKKRVRESRELNAGRDSGGSNWMGGSAHGAHIACYTSYRSTVPFCTMSFRTLQFRTIQYHTVKLCSVPSRTIPHGSASYNLQNSIAYRSETRAYLENLSIWGEGCRRQIVLIIAPPKKHTETQKDHIRRGSASPGAKAERPSDHRERGGTLQLTGAARTGQREGRKKAFQE